MKKDAYFVPFALTENGELIKNGYKTPVLIVSFDPERGIAIGRPDRFGEPKEYSYEELGLTGSQYCALSWRDALAVIDSVSVPIPDHGNRGFIASRTPFVLPHTKILETASA